MAPLVSSSAVIVAAVKATRTAILRRKRARLLDDLFVMSGRLQVDNRCHVQYGLIRAQKDGRFYDAEH